MAALLSSLPLVGARAPDAASFTFAEGTVQGSPTSWSNQSTGVQLAPGLGTFQWRLEADRLTVNTTTTRVLEVGRPPDFSRPAHEKEEGTTYDEARYGAATGNSTVTAKESRLVVWDAGSRLSVQSSPVQAVVSAASGNPWPVDTEPYQPAVALRVPASQIEAHFTGGPTIVSGNFSVYVTAANVTVKSASSTHLHVSGNWTEPVASGPGGAEPARHHYFQRVRLDVSGGRLEIFPTTRPASSLAGEFVFTGNLSATFTQANGSLSINGQNRALNNEPLKVDGEARLRAWNESATPGRLRAEVALGGGSVSSFESMPLEPNVGQPEAPAKIRTTTSAPERGGGWWWVLSAAVALPLVVFVAQRLEPWRPDVTDVEWAVLTGRMRRALRWGRRLVGRDPANPDAIFLYGTALLHRGQFDEIIRAIEPLALSVPVRLRTGIAYILGVSARRVGDGARAKRWGQEAFQEPSLRSRMTQDGGWDLGAPPPEPDELSSRAYS